MPYSIRKIGGGYYVVNSDTGQKKNKKAYPSKSAALPLMRALYRVMSEKEKK
jgi:hypothetical protein